MLFGRANINLREKCAGAPFAWEAAAAGVESKSESETRQREREGFLMQQVQTRVWHFVFPVRARQSTRVESILSLVGIYL